MPLDLTDTERLALADLLRQTIEADRFPLSPRVRTLKAILDKIEPPPVCGPATAAEVLRAAASRPSPAASAMIKPRQGGLAMGRLAMIIIGLVMLFAGCGVEMPTSDRTPAAFLYGAEHGDVGSINPPKGAANAI